MKAPAEQLDLSGRTIVVTGASGGVGSGIVQRLLAAGAHVIAQVRSASIPVVNLERASHITMVVADLVDDDAPEVIVEAAIAATGQIDGLVNNAGIQPLVAFEDLSADEWSTMLDVNLTAAHRLTQVVADALRVSQRAGSIVHIASIEARHPTPTHGHYATSKAALVMHAKAAALAYGPYGIRVNAILPGLIDRPGLAEAWPEGVRRWHNAAPLGRLGTPEDIGDGCVFLLSELSRWITGAELVIDGGVLTNSTW